MRLAPGIHEDVPAETYHGAEITDEPSFSASIAKVILQQSPLHAWWKHPKLNPQYAPTHSEKFEIGTAAHDLFLRGLDSMAVAPFDAWRSNEAKAHRAAARAAGRIPILEKDEQRIRQMVEAIRDQLAARDDTPPLFDAGKPEQTIVWREPNGVLCRARLDWLHDDFSAIDDLKTTNAGANAFDWGRRTFWSIGADIQARLYQRGINALTGKMPAFRFVTVETQAPHCLSALDLAQSAQDLADRKIETALEVWKRCLDSGEWPGYSAGIASVEVAWQELDFWERHGEEVPA